MAGMRQEKAVDGFWYRAGAGAVATSLVEQVPEPGQRIAVPTTVLFPRAWSNRIEEFFAAATLTLLDGVGHFSPLECADKFAAAITAAASAVPR
jgi:pimeloyl-ACP methyl ester carboxylesterase